jgi:hypothetical protein
VTARSSRYAEALGAAADVGWGMMEVVTMTTQGFVARLERDVPEVQQIVREHLQDNDELLLHLLTADLRRFAIEAHRSGDAEVLQRLLNVIDQGLTDGTESVDNAMAVSFVEDTGWRDPAMEPFIAVWPAGMQAEARRQQASSK